MKRARRGLYAGKHVRSGNNVSEDGGNRSDQHACRTDILVASGCETASRSFIV